MVKNLFETTWQKIWQIFFVAYASHTDFGVFTFALSIYTNKITQQ